MLPAQVQPEGTTAFSPLQGEEIKNYFSTAELAAFPDSMITINNTDQTLLKSEGVIFLLKQLGGLWRILGIFCSWFPSSLSDFVYDFLAKVRHRIFKTPEQLCPLVPEEIQSRLLV